MNGVSRSLPDLPFV